MEDIDQIERPSGESLVLLLPNGDNTMKKLEMSEVNSNLLLFTSVALTLTPFLLGDQLQFFVAGFMRDGLIAFDQFWHYLGGLLS